jgi:type I restriction enzyme S subunit
MSDGTAKPSVHLPTETVALGEIAEVRAGYGFPPALQGRSSGSLPFYKVSDMNLPGNETTMSASNNWITENDLGVLRARPFPSGTIVFPKVGAAIATNKKRMLTRDALVDNNVMGVLPERERCSSEFLFYWLLTLDLATLSSPGALPSITAAAIRRVEVTLPPMHEQRRIVGILSAIQRAGDAAAAVLATLQLVGRAGSAELIDRAAIDEPRSLVTIGEVTTRTSQIDPRRLGSTDFTYIDVSAVSSDSLQIVAPRSVPVTEAPSRARKLVQAGDVIFATVRPSLRRIASVPRSLDGAVCSTGFCVLRADPARLDAMYLYLACASKSFVDRVVSNEKGSSYPAVSDQEVRKELIPLPTLTEQRRIARILSTIQVARDATAATVRAREGVLTAALGHLFESAT